MRAVLHCLNLLALAALLAWPKAGLAQCCTANCESCVSARGCSNGVNNGAFSSRQSCVQQDRPLCASRGRGGALLPAARHTQSTPDPQVSLTNDPSFPLQLVSVAPQVSDDGTTFQGAKITLRNEGNAPCAAFAVSVAVTFSNSKTLTGTFREDLTPWGYAKPDPTYEIAPGQTWIGGNTGMVNVLTGDGSTVTGIEAGFEYIEMADGKKYYGPDPDGVAESIAMARFGHASERIRLLDIYKKGGLQALLDALKRR